MTRLIKSTPAIEGEDARLFLEKLRATCEPSDTEKEAKILELQRMKANYEKLQSIIKCDF